MITHDCTCRNCTWGTGPCSFLPADERPETQKIEHAQRIMYRGIIVTGIIWILMLAALFYTIKPHHGHAVYLPGGIEVYP